MAVDIKNGAESTRLGSVGSPEPTDPELGVAAEREVQRADPPVPPFDRAAVRGVGQLDDDVFGGEFDIGVPGVSAAVGEIARVSRDGPARLGVAAERLEPGAERCVVEGSPPGGLVGIVHTRGSGPADLSPRFGARAGTDRRSENQHL